MLNKIVLLVCTILCSFSITYTANKISDIKINKKSFLFMMLIITIFTFFLYFVTYNSEILILKIILCIITMKNIYKISVSKSIIIILLTMLFMTIGEIVSSIVLLNFLTISDIRNNLFAMIISNVIVTFTMIALANIKYINKKITKVVDKIESKNVISTIMLLVLSIVVIVYLLYNISINYSWNSKYIITILIMVSYIIISFIFFKDKIEYNMLEEKYDTLFEYFSEISESIDDLNLTTHEYKNQIAIVSNYIENKKYKKAKEYINDMAISLNKDEGLLVNLTDIPTGGLKGLLYYKIIVAKNQKVEIVLDVGKNIKLLFKKLSEENIKIITRIIGVYIDNATTEALKNNRTVNVEIYNLNNCLNFVISNKVSRDFDVTKLGKKGFTTKGKGHGQGLYLTNKLISKNKWLTGENKIVNNYYITRLMVDTKNIGK